VSPLAVVTWLGWACYTGAAGTLAAYVALIAGRRRWRRAWNAAGLFFTSIALSQTPSLFGGVLYGRGVWTAAAVTACLLASAALQAVAALRPRRPQPQTAPDDGGQDA